MNTTNSESEYITYFCPPSLLQREGRVFVCPPSLLLALWPPGSLTTCMQKYTSQLLKS